MERVIRVALYARVSTRDKGQDFENQLRELRQFAAAKAAVGKPRAAKHD